MKLTYSFRRILFETASAIHPGSGESDPVLDMPVQTDCNGLPTIQGSSIAGVLRHLYGEENDDLFGCNSKNSDQSCGSRLTVGNAVVLDENGTPAPPLFIGEISRYLEQIKFLPRRDHCRISVFGSAEDTGKFDRTVLPAGIRFMLEICVKSDTKEDSKKDADRIVALFHRPEFRLGGGTRDGFGRIAVLKITGRDYDLCDKTDRDDYLKRSSSLTEDPHEPTIIYKTENSSAQTFRYHLEPEDFWLFSDGTGLMDLDIRPKTEIRFDWTSGKPVEKSSFLLPVTSIKGALAHRTAYYYYKTKGIFADNMTQEEIKNAKEQCPAVLELFGSAKSKTNEGKIGKVLISDIYCDDAATKVFNHVKIDRFTGGALDGALFTEMAMHKGTLHLDITLLPLSDSEDKLVIENSFKEAVKDILKGSLPLGGGVMRGLGTMKGIEEVIHD